MPSAGYKVGILNSDGDEKSKRGDLRKSKHVSVSWNSEGGSDCMESGEEGELVDDREGGWHGSSKLKKSSHEAEHGSCSKQHGAANTVSAHVFCLGSCSVVVPTGGREASTAG